jgi:ferredoxin
LKLNQKAMYCGSLDCNIRRTIRLATGSTIGIVHILTGKMRRTAGRKFGDIMANPAKRVPENVLGDFFVDSTCIDCDACRQIAPGVFSQAAETSYVSHQPETPEDRRSALHASRSCPTGCPENDGATVAAQKRYSEISTTSLFAAGGFSVRVKWRIGFAGAV